ncbi:MAG: imidazole glycerol phosphate synthase subunit HisF [Flavobacteriales bacterium]|nr:imidazole glycerol phosphate synthase subunit HisF [Flavobacteriales bacterium]
MLKKRIIPCLDIKDGRTVKGVNFLDLRDAGDPVELAASYAKDGADELVFLDITATVNKRKTLRELVSRIAENIDIPFTVGGGISALDDVEALLSAGADKVSVNSAAVRRPELLNEISKAFGNQCLVISIDAMDVRDIAKVCVDGGRTPTARTAVDWAREAADRGAGEILLTSMKKDGTKSGFDIELTASISSSTTLPIIASGGAGTKAHFSEVFLNGNADAALAASIFHFGEVPIPELKEYLKTVNIPVR